MKKISLMLMSILVMFLAMSCGNNSNEKLLVTLRQADSLTIANLRHDVEKLKSEKGELQFSNFVLKTSKDSLIAVVAQKDKALAACRAKKKTITPPKKDDSALRKQISDLTTQVDRLTRQLNDLQLQSKKVVVAPPPVQNAVVQEVPITSVTTNVPPPGKMWVVVEGVSGPGKFWGPMTNDWEHWNLKKGVGELITQEGEDIWINGKVGDYFLDAIVEKKLGKVKIIADNGQVYVFCASDIHRRDVQNRKNLSFSYYDGKFR
jgi:hypothetical protein